MFADLRSVLYDRDIGGTGDGLRAWGAEYICVWECFPDALSPLLQSAHAICGLHTELHHWLL